MPKSSAESTWKFNCSLSSRTACRGRSWVTTDGGSSTAGLSDNSNGSRPSKPSWSFQAKACGPIGLETVRGKRVLEKRQRVCFIDRCRSEFARSVAVSVARLPSTTLSVPLRTSSSIARAIAGTQEAAPSHSHRPVPDGSSAQSRRSDRSHQRAPTSRSAPFELAIRTCTRDHPASATFGGKPAISSVA